MKILKMRATFGKLQSAELALGEGLNVIEAPNEGGKSTWSAFLRAMLYGINTKERDRQGYLAEKNRYQPWSGAAMEGSVELLWQGRSVTLRRGPKGSTPFGRFEAVYTGTAELVPGLTGDNAGETLTGVPREVFERSAFVGQGGAAIDGAPALEARIAALASSGEEDVSYSQVERRLRDWLNRRKHNKTGLIPRLEEELALQRTALQELRHRMKNNLQMLANLTRSRGCDPAESPPVQTALLDTANRLLSLAATLDGIVQVSREKVSLLQILEQIRRYMLQTLLPSARRVTIHVGGEDVIVSADCASSVALVVNELVQNALKYAFPSGQAGRIGIELHSGRPLCQLTVWDNGVGFQADRPRPGGAGLELASTIVREKLTGEWSLESGPGGTRISFDFLEQ